MLETTCIRSSPSPPSKRSAAPCAFTGTHTALTDLSWISPLSCLKPLADGVHVWRLSLDLPTDQVKVLRGFLAEDEISRAGRFYRETDRLRFIVGRGLLRALLAKYLGITPGDIQFQYNRWGKPYLHSERHPSAPLFNFSHSHDLALCALSGDLMVGVDIERVRPSVE